MRSISVIYHDLIETFHVMPTVYTANLLDVMLAGYLPSTLKTLRKFYPENVNKELEGKPYTKEEYRLAYGILDVVKDVTKAYTFEYLKSLSVQQEFGSLDENYDASKNFAKVGFLQAADENGIPDAVKEILEKLIDSLD